MREVYNSKFEKDIEKTKVIFYNEGNTVLAVFPEMLSDTTGKFITCYSHVGQHSGLDPEYVKDFPLANEKEYKDLHTELENLGYNLEVIA